MAKKKRFVKNIEIFRPKLTVLYTENSDSGLCRRMTLKLLGVRQNVYYTAYTGHQLKSVPLMS